MKRLAPILIAGLLISCSKKYPYTGAIADAEGAILAEPLGLVHLIVEARGTNWLRYRMVKDVSGLRLTNGAATVRVEAGRVILSGSTEVRSYITRALKVE